MKKIYFLLASAVISCGMQAQSIPNGNFENWSSATYEEPVGFSNSNFEAIFRCNSPANVVKSTDFQQGNFAVELTTVVGGGDTCFGYIVSSPNPQGGNPCNWPGGIPYNQAPTGIRGYYKSNIQSPDSGGILVAFRNNGVCLGLYLFKLGGVNATYTPFSFAFNPPIAGTPDTMIFAAVSSDAFSGIALNGSMLKLDSVSLIGVTQVAAMNGDFENWQSQTVYSPISWYPNGNSGNGLTRTTDAYAGQYAAEMTTYLGDNNGVPRANGGGVSTGYYVNNCGGPNCLKGGHPFTNQIDTLCFYYKYAPMANDTANVSIAFKNGGTTIWNQGSDVYGAAASYTYREIPFNTMATIDSVIVSFQSSQWGDTALVFIGSTFKVDEVHFKSQPLSTGISQYNPAMGIKAFPNPAADGEFTISNAGQFDLVRVYNVYGQEVRAKVIKANGEAKVHIETPGAYTIFVNSRGKVSNLKVIVGKE